MKRCFCDYCGAEIEEDQEYADDEGGTFCDEDCAQSAEDEEESE